MLTLSFATGTEPNKWFTRFEERTDHGGLRTLSDDDPLSLLVDATADLALVRLPDPRMDNDDTVHVVELYQESMGVALPKEHTLTLLDVVEPSDLDGEIINYITPPSLEVDVAAVRTQLQMVAANVGVVIAPRPLLKVLSGKLVEHREFSDPQRYGQARTRIALVWKKERDGEDIQDFVGIAKGRTVQSSRQSNAKKVSAREKTLAKQKRRKEAGKKPVRKGGRRKR
ncbi:LysR family transcriptional regulator substrate-binding protein [Corynebacterium diphtheriae]|uniref:LysR family transcriptional regulator substrate-binding protein n=1 Tax=Corynebacterium diphtheriae TaxID=1717 RepID=UPI0015F68958|nr:LysR family transcriptional regulator substrate-binding protein [Corynebacterium diphtheriae]